MDLPELLARAGVQPDAVAELMTWARARTSALLPTINPKSPLGQSLAPGLAQLVMRQGPESENDVLPVPPAPALTSVIASEAPIVRRENPSRSSPRATARVISRPFLGAAVEAALQGGESSGNLAQGTEEIPAPPPSISDAPAALDEDDASIGGFTRFASSVRRQPVAPVERPSEDRAPLSHGFALHAEREAGHFMDVPAPPSFEASESGVRLRMPNIRGDSERSNSLVVGIPDDEGADVPMPRARGRSGSGAAASRPPSRPNPAEHSLELNLRIEDPELSSALFRMIPASGETSTMLSAAASASLMRATPDLGEPSLQIPIHVEEASSMVPVPLADDDEDDDETAALHEPEDAPAPIPPTPAPRSDDTVIGRAPTRHGARPPPPPLRRGSSHFEPAAEPAQPISKPRGRGNARKKIVELSTPVVRPVTARPTAPEPTTQRPARETARPEPASAIPNYLRDDDE